MSEASGGSWLGRAIVILIVWVVLAGLAYGAYVGINALSGGGSASAGSDNDTGPGPDGSQDASTTVDTDLPEIEIGIAYGTEKRRWLEAALKAWEKTQAGKTITVNLIGMGSLEGARAVTGGDERIHVWCPASSMYRGVFERDWELTKGVSPIASEHVLALTPMVFVMWDERHDAFVQKYQAVDFRSIGQALDEPAGWQAIANEPNWGVFKFGHTHPNKSNSGLMTLVLMAYDFHDKSRGLAMADILDPEFQAWMTKTELGVSGLISSTGTMMRDMVLRGPSQYDAVMVYESVAIDFLKNAEGRWGKIRVVYPPRNMWNDNPYYILDTEWSSDEHRKAAKVFLDFLMSRPIQELALSHGFRPGNTDVPVRFPASPFEKYAEYGLNVDLASVCENPSPEVLTNLLQSWVRSVPR